MVRKAVTRARLSSLQIRIDCDICGKPIVDGTPVFMFTKGIFRVQGMTVDSYEGEIFGHQTCYLAMTEKKPEQGSLVE